MVDRPSFQMIQNFPRSLAVWGFLLASGIELPSILLFSAFAKEASQSTIWKKWWRDFPFMNISSNHLSFCAPPSSTPPFSSWCLSPFVEGVSSSLKLSSTWALVMIGAVGICGRARWVERRWLLAAQNDTKMKWNTAAFCCCICRPASRAIVLKLIVCALSN